MPLFARPSLPVVDYGLVKMVYAGLAIEATSGWQAQPVPLRPLEVVEITITGEFVYHYREWTSSGACGKKKLHVEEHRTQPDKPEGKCGFGLAEADTSSLFHEFGRDFPRKAGGADQIVMPSGLSQSVEARLACATTDALSGGGGNNAGAYSLLVEVDPKPRIRRMMDTIEHLTEAIASIDPKAGKWKLTPESIAASVLHWFTPRVILESQSHREFCAALEALGRAIFSRFLPSIVAETDPAKKKVLRTAAMGWLGLADWLAEWSVTETAGGRKGFAEGWLLRGEVASSAGKMTIAREFYKSALKYADPEAVGKVLYQFAKASEIAGFFFSKEGSEVRSVDLAREIIESTEAATPIGAYDLYHLSLSEGRTKTTDAVERSIGKPDFLDVLQNYDAHYGIARLAYLRHTTESLSESAAHFRMCRRYARYRWLTHPALYPQYSLEMLFNDARRAYNNPFHSGGRADVGGMPVGLDRASVRLEIDVEGPSAAEAEQTNQLNPRPLISSKKISSFSWLAVGGRAGLMPLGLRKNARPPTASASWTQLKKAWDRAPASVSDIAKFYDATFDEYKAPNVGLFESQQVFAKDLLSMLIASTPADIRDSLRPGHQVVLTDWVQNRFHWFEFALRACSRDVGDSDSYFGGLSWSRFRLAAAPSVDAAGLCTLVFSGQDGTMARVKSTFVESRLRLSMVTLEAPDGRSVRVKPSPGLDTDDRFTLQVELARPTPGVAAGDGVPDDQFTEAYKIECGYHPQTLVPTRVSIVDNRAKSALPDAVEANDKLIAEQYRSLQWTYNAEFDPGEEDTGYLSGHGTMASIYVPFHDNHTPEAYRLISNRDARWALAQGALPSPVARCIIQELGRRITDSQPEPSGGGEFKDRAPVDARDTIFDFLGGHFDGLGASAELHANAAAALFVHALELRSHQDAIGFVYLRRAANTISRILKTVAPDEAHVARALAAYAPPLVGAPLPELVTIPNANTDAKAKQLSPVSDDLALQQQVTRDWLNALSRIMVHESPAQASAAYHLVRAVVAAGLAEFGRAYLDAVGAFDLRTGTAMAVEQWLQDHALPEEPDVEAAEQHQVAAQDWSAVLENLLDACGVFNSGAAADVDFGPSLSSLNLVAGRGQDRQAVVDSTTAADEGEGAPIAELAHHTLAKLGREYVSRPAEVFTGLEGRLLSIAGLLGYAAYGETRLGAEASDHAASACEWALSVFRDLSGRPIAKESVDQATPSVVVPPDFAEDWKKALDDHITDESLKTVIGLSPLAITQGGPWQRELIKLKRRPADRALDAAPWLDANAGESADDDDRKGGSQGGAAASAAHLAGQVSITEMNEANHNSWELVLNDEPFGDSCAALLSLADRHLARKNGSAAEKSLHEVLWVLTKLRQDEDGSVSPADRWQLEPLLRRTRQRLAWLGQGRDAYGRFLTQAPPRRLDVLARQFSRHLNQYRSFLENSRAIQEKRDDKELRYGKQVELQRSDARHALTRARIDLERGRRVVAHTQKRISALQERRRELTHEVDFGKSQYGKGIARTQSAVDGLGALAASAALSVAGAASPALAKTAGEVSDAVKEAKRILSTVEAVRNGENPLRAALTSYGQDVLTLSFSAVGEDSFFGSEAKSFFRDAVMSYAADGRVDLGKLAGASLRRVGEEMLQGAAEQVRSRIEEIVRAGPELATARELATQFATIKAGVEGVVNEWKAKGFETIDELRDVVNEVRLSVDGRVQIIKSVISEASDSAVADALQSVLTERLDVADVVSLYNRLATDSKSDLSTFAASATGTLARALTRPATWWEACTRPDKDGRRNLTPRAFERSLTQFRDVLAGISRGGLEGVPRPQWSPTLKTRLSSLCDLVAAVGQASLRVPIKRLAEQHLRTQAGLRAAVLAATKNASPTEHVAVLKSALDENQEDEARLMEITIYIGEVLGAAGAELSAISTVPKETAKALSEAVDQALEGLFGGDDELGRSLRRAAVAVDSFVRDATGSLVQAGRELDPDRPFSVLNDALDEVEPGATLVSTLVSTNGRTGDVVAALEAEVGETLGLRNGVLEALVNAGLQAPLDREIAGGAGPIGGFTLADVTLGGGTVRLPDAAIKAADKDLFVGRRAAQRILQAHADDEAALLGVSLKEAGKVSGDAGANTKAALDKLAKPNATDENEEPNSTDEDEKPKVAPKEGAEETAAKGSTGYVGNADPRPVNYTSSTSEISELVGNPGVQAMLAVVSAAYPVVGIAVKLVGLVDNWLSGYTERNAGAQKVMAAMEEMRGVDEDLSNSRHQRELAALELLVAKDDARLAEEQLRGLRQIEQFTAAVQDRDVYLQRYLYKRMWASLELMSYQLYVLQKGFEYEYDSGLSEMFERWPALQSFKGLLELSPGVLAGEFGRTNVHADLAAHHSKLGLVEDVLQTVRDVAIGTRHRDSLTISLRHDFPNAWERFRLNGAPLSFELPLRRFLGVVPSGHPLRHSIKIRTARVVPVVAHARPLDGYQEPGVPGSRHPTAMEFETSLVGTERMGKRLELESELRREHARALAREFPDRLKIAVYHAGEGTQMDERGSFARIEWGPQVLDSNLGVLDADEHYNPLEGLTPAARWSLELDTSSGIQAADLEDVQLHIEFTFGRLEENLRKAVQQSTRPELYSLLPETEERAGRAGDGDQFTNASQAIARERVRRLGRGST